MALNIKKLTPWERYELIGKLIEEIKLRTIPIKHVKLTSHEKISKVWQDIEKIFTFLIQ